MIGASRRVRVFVYREPVDMRKSFDTLSGLVTGRLSKAVTTGDVYVFVGKGRTRAKALYFDGTGLCLLSKRMIQGRFAAPWSRPGTGPIEMTMSELSLLIEGSEVVMRSRLSPDVFIPHVPMAAMG